MRFAPMKPTPPGRFRRVPPAIFPPLLGMVALVLAWTQAAAQFGLPVALPQVLSGMVTALAIAAFVSYGGKIAQRPAVLAEELRILPGRGGCAAAVVAVYALATMAAGYAPALARGILVAGFALQLVFWVVVIPVMFRTPGQGRVTPVWHLTFVGPIVGALASVAVGWGQLATVIWYPCAAMAIVIWTLSIKQVMGERVPAQLRPFLAIHLAPFAVLGMVAYGIDMPFVAQLLGVIALALIVTAVLSARWLLEAGFSPFWGAFTFPLAASAGLFLRLATLSPMWRYPAVVVLVVATLAIPVILLRVWQAWIKGSLAVKSNAAIA